MTKAVMPFILTPPALGPFVLLSQAGVCCGGMAGFGGAYQYAWLRARALAAQQAWARFDPRWN